MERDSRYFEKIIAGAGYRVTEEGIRHLKELRASGKLYREIAGEMRLHETTVYRLLNPEHDKKCKIATAKHLKKRKAEWLLVDSSLEAIRMCIKYKLMDIRSSAKRGGYLPCTATTEQLASIFTGTCDCCGVEVGYHKIRLEHCHVTGRFRGWTCRMCNVLIGYAHDSPELFDKLAAYLRRKLIIFTMAQHAIVGKAVAKMREDTQETEMTQEEAVRRICLAWLGEVE